MNFERIVEQIAFGKESPKRKNRLGLYLSPDVIYLSEVRRDKEGRQVVEQLVRIPIPADGKSPSATATMSTDFLADPAKISGLVRQSMSQFRWNTTSVRVTLSHHLGLLRYFTMPVIERKFLASAVPVEAKKYIPIPFDALAHDFQASLTPPDAAGKQRLGVLIAVTQKKNIDNVTGLLESLGLKLDGLELAPLSVLRLWGEINPRTDPAPFVHVHIDNGNVRVMVVDREAPVFFREVFLGESVTLDDLRRIDLPGCVAFAQKQIGVTGISTLRVSGNLPNLPALMEAFAQETSIKAVLQDTPNLLSIKSGDWGGYAAIGAATQPSVQAAEPLDLAATNRVSDQERRAARDILAVGGIAAALLTAVGLATSASYSYRVRELHHYKGQVSQEIAAALQGKSSNDIQAAIKEMQDQEGHLRPLTGRDARMRPSVVIKEIVETMPQKVWLDRIAVTNLVRAGDRGSLEVILRGYAQDLSVADEQALAFQFKGNLVNDPHLGKVFDTQIDVTDNSPKSDEGPMGLNPKVGLDPKALARRLSERTQFTINMREKR